MSVEEDPPPQDRKEARRLQAWKLRQKGWKQTDIAEALGVTAGAVSQWMSRARKGEGDGKEALRSQKRSGRPPRPTSDQLQELPELLKKEPNTMAFAARYGRALASVKS